MPIPKSDIDFLYNIILPYFGIRKVDIEYVNIKRRFPDCWIDTSRHPPLISVTQEWAKQPPHERRKRLVHEVAHAYRLDHGRFGRLNYNTYPALDTFSRAMYLDILSGSRKFDLRRFI